MILSPEFVRTIPVSLAMVNKKMNPIANNMGVLYCNEPPHKAIQVKILIPVGTAMITVTAGIHFLGLIGNLKTFRIKEMRKTTTLVIKEEIFLFIFFQDEVSGKVPNNQ
ncbi:hypothetical protein L484_015614 [Morus notabilis]|uniref:Uncharacterized protein n=1 Tax=Morus notabilis TaxID=981085 RepID=W9QY14_9ROSA|nr:hypothetical protein L484_015614 [Morus notabilis]